MKPVILVHGPANAGKSWQAKQLAERHGYALLSSGELLRNSQDPEITERLATGQLARSEDVERLMQAALAAVPGDQVVVIDGFPRKINEFHQLERWLAELGRFIALVLEVVITPEESHARSELRGRHDDSAAAIERKWQWYRQDVGQVLAACREQGWLRQVDGMGSREAVAERVEQAARDGLAGVAR